MRNVDRTFGVSVRDSEKMRDLMEEDTPHRLRTVRVKLKD